VTAAFHARERRVDQLLDFLGEAMGVGPVRKVSELANRIAEWDGDVVIAVDALDEAAQGHGVRMVGEVVVPLSRLPGVKVLVGARPGVCDWWEIGIPGDQAPISRWSPVRRMTSPPTARPDCCALEAPATPASPSSRLRSVVGWRRAP